MPWLELKIDTDERSVPNIEQWLDAAGAQAITYTDAGDQPILEPDVGEMPLWADIVVVGLFSTDTNTAEVESTLKDQANGIGLKYRWDILEDRVWEREWMQYHQPVQFGDRFWVFHQSVDSDKSTLLLDPGLAFGTGAHPTTALCLDWIANQSWHDRTLIDYGCGSGILAIASCLLGCAKAICADIDPQALLATRENATRNNLGDNQIQLRLANANIDLKADILVANILADPLTTLAEDFAGFLPKGGLICLSGILKSQKETIISSYQPWFSQFSSDSKGDWLRIVATKH